MRTLTAAAVRRLLGRPTWRGTYKTLEDVPKSGTGHSGGSWLADAEAATRAVLAGDAVEEHALLTVLVASISGPVSVLDVGGAMGRAYLQLKRALPIAPAYTIVETAAVCARGRELVPEITFVDRLPEAASPDVVYVRTSLQYLDDPLGTLRRLFGYGPRFVLLADTSAGEIPTFATAQLNIPGSVIPYWFLSINAVIEAASGYELLMRASGKRKLPRMAVPPAYRLERTVDLLFGRATTR